MMRRFFASLVTGFVFFLSTAIGRTTPPELMNVELLLASGHVEEAEASLLHLPQSNRDLQTSFLWAKTNFLKGDYTLAANDFERALSQAQGATSSLRDTDLSEWKQLLVLSRITATATKSFKVSSSLHFEFYYEEKNEILIHYAKHILEKAWIELEKDFSELSGGIFSMPSRRVRVEIYSEPEILSQVSGLTPEQIKQQGIDPRRGLYGLSKEEIHRSGTVALSRWNRLMILSPSVILQGYPWMNTLTHEFSHLLLSRLSKEMAPVWLQEGLAKFEETRWKKNARPPLNPRSQQLLLHALKHDDFVPIEQMHPSLAKLPSQNRTALAFAEAESLVRYIYARGGMAAFTPWITATPASDSSAQSLFTTWKNELKKLPTSKGPLVIYSEMTFQDPENKRENSVSLQIIPEAKRKKIELFSRLGDLLYEKSPKAAVKEYIKARDAGGTQVVILPLLRKLALAELSIGERERARSTMDIALRYDLDSSELEIAAGELQEGPAAVAHFETALSINPFDPRPHCRLAAFYKTAKRTYSTDNFSLPVDPEKETAFCNQLKE